MEELVESGSPISQEHITWFRRLIDEWAVIADLCFSDLVLWVPKDDPNIFKAVAHVRPTTGPTSLADDMVGEEISYDPESLVTQAFLSHEVIHSSENGQFADIPVGEHAVPLLVEGECVGVMGMYANRLGLRYHGELEENYIRIGIVLCNMVMRHEFPSEESGGQSSFSPRVGDGVIRVDQHGDIVFASPNARSTYRHLGVLTALEGENFVSVTSSFVRQSAQQVSFPVAETLSGKAYREIEVRSGRVSAQLRFHPLIDRDGTPGLLVICRDTTELMQKEQQLITREATIREIHHRVKNSLAMVAALLRLQSRRVHSDEARKAIGDAMQRVEAIAAVHNILSHTYSHNVDFDEVADKLFTLISDSTGKVRIIRDGSFGVLPGDVAERLSLVLTEICQNAVEHGLQYHSGEVFVTPDRQAERMVVTVFNEGEPLPEGFNLKKSTSLGLSIARTIVQDIGGKLKLEPGPDGGTVATITVPVF
jgi:two-component sensor histidine kinase